MTQFIIYFAIASISATLGFFACALFAARKINRLENMVGEWEIGWLKRDD